MTPEEIIATDRRETAIHEAGHLTVAAAEFIYGSASIHPREVADMEEKLTGGYFRSFHAVQSAAVSVAGVVAECLEEEEKIEARDILDWIYMEAVIPSTTDFQGIPDNYNDRLAAIESALATLRKYRSFFNWAVSELITSGTITNGMTQDEWNRFELAAKLYHRTSSESAASIEAGGFKDSDGAPGGPAVFLSDRPLRKSDIGSAPGELFEVLLFLEPAELFYNFELLDGRDFREFLVPAEILNDPSKCRFRRVSPAEAADLIALAESDCGEWWNEYPPGEPEKTWAELREDA